MGKEENAGHQHFLIFQQYFQNLYFYFNSPDCAVKIYKMTLFFEGRDFQ